MTIATADVGATSWGRPSLGPERLFAGHPIARALAQNEILSSNTGSTVFDHTGNCPRYINS
jgi:hypothetical protein